MLTSIIKKSTLALLVIFTLSLTSCFAQEKHTDDLNWLTDYKEAVTIAKKENKPILLNFTGSDWCKWCFRLTDEVFSQDTFKKYADKEIVLVKVDFPRYKEQSDDVKAFNRELMNKYGVRGFPTIMVIDKNEMALGKTGYKQGGPQVYIDHLKAMYKK